MFLRAVTWQRDSHGLFDYEKSNTSTKNKQRDPQRQKPRYRTKNNSQPEDSRRMVPRRRVPMRPQRRNPNQKRKTDLKSPGIKKRKPLKAGRLKSKLTRLQA